ncbi:hypothetical protein OESDEN_06525 [Oesophagostomum dentatum]|uniref:Uncharacterized protein n=1 Tax=Oesophagostomum dentatum TaxID=61180 RepID=A0A0B1TDX1_OESDE|nr:hypothetical protein OESDEN_06525 [Oesophagostomum dentatum]
MLLVALVVIAFAAEGVLGQCTSTEETRDLYLKAFKKMKESNDLKYSCTLESRAASHRTFPGSTRNLIQFKREKVGYMKESLMCALVELEKNQDVVALIKASKEFGCSTVTSGRPLDGICWFSNEGKAVSPKSVIQLKNECLGATITTTTRKPYTGTLPKCSQVKEGPCVDEP